MVITLLGLLFIATLFLPRLNREWRPQALLGRASTGGPIVAGLAFAVAWLPCTGPTLGAILTAAGTEQTVGEGGVLLAFYALGLAVPFLLCAVAFSSVSGFFRFFRDHYTAITVVSGVVLVVMGVMLFTNELTRLNSEALALMDRLGINFFGELCSYISSGASTPSRSRQRASTALVSTHSASRKRLVGGVEHLAVAVEGREVLGRLVRVGGQAVGRAADGGLGDLGGKRRAGA